MAPGSGALGRSVTADYLQLPLGTRGGASTQAPRHRAIGDIMRSHSGLIDKGLAIPQGRRYVDVTRITDYGKRSPVVTPRSRGRSPDPSRPPLKRHPGDSHSEVVKPGAPAWRAPGGPGRPGWQIECSAIA